VCVVVDFLFTRRLLQARVRVLEENWPKAQVEDSLEFNDQPQSGKKSKLCSVQ